jgi:hypothetical protein
VQQPELFELVARHVRPAILKSVLDDGNINGRLEGESYGAQLPTLVHGLYLL